jgi:hypothetical protein
VIPSVLANLTAFERNSRFLFVRRNGAGAVRLR